MIYAAEQLVAHEGVTIAVITSAAAVIVAAVSGVLSLLASRRNGRTIDRIDDTLNHRHPGMPSIREMVDSIVAELGHFRVWRDKTALWQERVDAFMVRFDGTWRGLNDEISNAAGLNHWQEQTDKRLDTLEREEPEHA